MTRTYKQDQEDDDRAEMLREKYAERRKYHQLLAHPNCRDPDHPGCQYCRPYDDDEDEDDDNEEY